MVTSTQDRSLLPASEERQLYDHWLECLQSQSCKEVIDNFCALFIRGKKYFDPKISLALDKIVNARDADRKFPSILNCCCHIIINRWQSQPENYSAILELIALFAELSPLRTGYPGTSARLRQLMMNFIQTDYYIKLQRLGRVIRQNQEINQETKLIANLIYRYPYLYDRYLLAQDSSYEHQQTVRRIKATIQRRFEFELSQYVTYQVLLNQRISNGQSFHKPERVLQPVENPTLLSDRELDTALKQFVGIVEGSHTYRDLSQIFLAHSRQISSYKTFKNNLYEYLISSIDAKYGKHHFNKKMYKKIQAILPQFDSQKPDEFLMLRTNCQILNFLVVESQQLSNHYVLVDLITNLGPTSTVSLLLKLLLLSPKVKPHLEKRFAMLFDQYESFPEQRVPWLVKVLENLQIAFSIHFGRADLSCLKQIL